MEIPLSVLNLVQRCEFYLLRVARSHCRYRNRGTEYVRESGIKRTSGPAQSTSANEHRGHPCAQANALGLPHAAYFNELFRGAGPGLQVRAAGRLQDARLSSAQNLSLRLCRAQD
jgi:hypothetical protein